MRRYADSRSRCNNTLETINAAVSQLAVVTLRAAAGRAPFLKRLLRAERIAKRQPTALRRSVDGPPDRPTRQPTDAENSHHKQQASKTCKCGRRGTEKDQEFLAAPTREKQPDSATEVAWIIRRERTPRNSRGSRGVARDNCSTVSRAPLALPAPFFVLLGARSSPQN